MNPFEIIKTVRVTEKGTRQSDKLNQYTVVADRRANKIQIRQAVEEIFDVTVLRVNTMNSRGKVRRQRTRAAGKAQLLEMGGNGPFVVMDDADLQAAAAAASVGCFLGAGQSCSAAERLLVHEAVREEFAHPESRVLLELVVGAIDSPALAARVREGLEQSFAFTRDVVDLLVADSPFASVMPLDLVAQVAASAFFGLAVMELVGAEVDIDGITALVNALLQFSMTGSPPASK
jgi:ribosomal protein L23